VNYQNVQPDEYQQFVLHQATQNLSGRPTDLAPKWSGDLTGDFLTDVAGGYHLIAEISGVYSSSYFLEGSDDPLIEQHPYLRADARLSLESPDRRWGLDIIGKNLTNQKIRTFGSPQAQSPGSIITTLQEPLNVAAQLRYRW
jgi:outer membrane receptor protein involved in Fe transport